MIKFNDNFDSNSLDASKWVSKTLNNGTSIIVENGKLKFKMNGSWTGGYIQPNCKFFSRYETIVEYDYTIASKHYSSADKPYAAFFNSDIVPSREYHYNMMTPTKNNIIIYFADNSDDYNRTKLYLWNTDTLISTNVNYPVNTTLHVKLILNKKCIEVYINDNKLLYANIPYWESLGTSMTFEINSNSYGYFEEHYDNFSLINKSAEYLLSKNGSRYSIKPEFYIDNNYNKLGDSIDIKLPEESDKYMENYLNNFIIVTDINGELFRPIDKFDKFNLIIKK